MEYIVTLQSINNLHYVVKSLAVEAGSFGTEQMTTLDPTSSAVRRSLFPPPFPLLQHSVHGLKHVVEQTMSTAHRRNNNATYPNSHIRSNEGIHIRSTGSGVSSLPLPKDAVSHAGFDVADGGLSVAISSLRLSSRSSHPRGTSGGSSSGSLAQASNSRLERSNNLPPRHRGGSEKEYAQLDPQSPREKHQDAYFEVCLLFLDPIDTDLFGHLC
jgi:hypothetical protein